MCQNLWCEKGCRFRPLLSAYRGTRMKVPSLTSNRSTKRSNLIRERPLRRMILDRIEVIYVTGVLETLEATGASIKL